MHFALVLIKLNALGAILTHICMNLLAMPLPYVRPTILPIVQITNAMNAQLDVRPAQA